MKETLNFSIETYSRPTAGGRGIVVRTTMSGPGEVYQRVAYHYGTRPVRVYYFGRSITEAIKHELSEHAVGI